MFNKNKKKLLSTTILSAVLGGALLLTACNDTSETKEPDNSKVLVTSDAGNVTQKKIDDLKKILPAQYKAMPANQLTPMLIEEALTEEILDNEVIKRKIKDSAEYKKELVKIEKQASRKILLDILGKEAVSDQAITDSYNKTYGSPVVEVRARHILVKTEKEAKNILAQLKSGANFAQLAKIKSTGPSGKTGGELGWFSQGKMVPEFSKVAFALKDKEFGIAKTQFGWHVLQREEQRTQPKPPLDDKMKKLIRSKLMPQALQKLVKDLKASNHVDNLYLKEQLAKQKAEKAQAQAQATTTPTTTDDKSTATDDKSTATDDKSTTTDDKSTATDDKSTATDDKSKTTN